MNEKKAKRLRGNIIAQDRESFDFFVSAYGNSEKQIRRAMTVCGLKTSGTNLLNSANYAANVCRKMKRKQLETATQVCISQRHGSTWVPKKLWRQDASGDWVYGRQRIVEIVKEALFDGQESI